MAYVVHTSFVAFLRGFLSALFFFLFGFGAILIGATFLPIQFVLGEKGRPLMLRIVRVAYVLFCRFGAMTRLFVVKMSEAARARMRSARGVVIAANHLTLIDIVILIANLPPSTSIAKAAAGGNFFYSRIVRSLFLLNDDTFNLLSKAAELLDEGLNLIVFPEGTRVPYGSSVHVLKRGAAQIALHSRRKVLPVRISCHPVILAKGQPWWQVGDECIRYELEVGEEIVVEEPPSHTAAVALTDKISKALFKKG